jgi:hypothetical protein
MTYAILTASALLAILYAVGIISALLERNRSTKGRVHLPGLFAWIGGVCGGLFLIPTVAILFTDESPWLSIVFLCFSLLGGSLSLGYLNCRITYDTERFTHKNIFGIKRTYTYDQITGLKEGTHEDVLYMGRRFAMIDEYAEGNTDFLLMAKKRYHALSGGRPIPRVKPRIPDVFNGHVEGGTGLLVVYGFLGLLCLGFLCFMIAYVYFMPPAAASCERHETVLERGEMRGDTLYLYPAASGEDGLHYAVRFLDDEVDTDAIRAACDGQTAVTVYVKRVTPKHGDPYYAVKALSAGDTVLLTFEDSQRLHQNEYWPLIPFMGLFTLLWAVFVVFSIRVGRHPERYSKRVIRLFFKEGYVH